MERATVEQTDESEREVVGGWRDASDGTMPCPVCGHPMPDLKGGRVTICAECGFKDSCCY